MNFLSAVLGLILISLAIGLIFIPFGVTFVGALKIAACLFGFLFLFCAGVFFIGCALVP